MSIDGHRCRFGFGLSLPAHAVALGLPLALSRPLVAAAHFDEIDAVDDGR